MKDELSDENAKAILEALDKAIAEGPWEESSFLRVIGKNLREMRDKFASKVSSKAEEGEDKLSKLAERVALRSGQMEVYVGLYSSSGRNIQSWTHILANLPRQMTSRPIYPNEEDVKAAIRAKENKMNEAYAVIHIKKEDLIPTPPDKTPKDRFGKPLLSLKDKAIEVENIQRFVHITGTYKYLGGRLVKIPPNEEA